MFCRVRFRKFPLVFVVLACVLNVSAQTPEPTPKQVAIHELLKLLRATEFSKTILVTLIDQYSRALAQDTIDKFEKKPGSPQAKAKMKELTQEFYGRVSQRLQDEVPARIRYDELLTGLYVEAYDQSFSESEINAYRLLQDFYGDEISGFCRENLNLPAAKICRAGWGTNYDFNA
jgi:hypothetical protein